MTLRSRQTGQETTLSRWMNEQATGHVSQITQIAIVGPGQRCWLVQTYWMGVDDSPHDGDFHRFMTIILERNPAGTGYRYDQVGQGIWTQGIRQSQDMHAQIVSDLNSYGARSLYLVETRVPDANQTDPVRNIPRVQRVLGQAIQREVDQALFSLRPAIELPLPQGSYKCPLCGNEMVARRGRFGVFYGCSTWRLSRCNSKLDERGHITFATWRLMEQRNLTNGRRYTKTIAAEPWDPQAIAQEIQAKAEDKKRTRWDDIEIE